MSHGVNQPLLPIVGVVRYFFCSDPKRNERKNDTKKNAKQSN